MGRIYDFYERRVFPHLMDRTMRGLNELRTPTLASAHGEVLELGFGTGLNLRHYPSGVTRLATADPMNSLAQTVERRIAAAPFPVDVHHLPADGHLPFAPATFDCVTVTWTLCSIPDPVAALVEAARVLKPGGSLFFIEHGRSDDPRIARWQDRLNPAQRVLACGCNINRKIDEIVTSAGFAIERLDRFCADGFPRLLGEMYRGAASRT